MQSGSTVTFQSSTGAPININKNIWGPGNLNLSCSANVNTSIGVPPPQESIKGLPSYTYTQSISEYIP